MSIFDVAQKSDNQNQQITSLGANNQVRMLDVKNVEETRQITGMVIDGYLKTV